MHVVKSVARTLQILELFDEMRHPVNVTAVSSALGYPQSSASALLRSMTAMGYLDYDPHARTYSLTDRVPLLGHWVSRPLFSDGKLLRLMDGIGEKTGHLVALAARNGDHAQYVHLVNASIGKDYRLHLGDMRPLARTGVGQSLLSVMSDQKIKSLFHRLNASCKSTAEIVKVPQLLADIEKARALGAAVSIGQYRSDLAMIGILLPSGHTSRPLAIGIGGPAAVIAAEQEALIALAKREIEAAFGQTTRVEPEAFAQRSGQDMLSHIAA